MQGNAFENVVGEIAAILFRPQCIKAWMSNINMENYVSEMGYRIAHIMT